MSDGDDATTLGTAVGLLGYLWLDDGLSLAGEDTRETI
jgi:hypothetical protein